jgi:endonuclease YncB( thermonuclease family)
VATGAAHALSGTVTHVTDGDTLWVRPDGGGKPVKVRMEGLDAPEHCQAWGPQATAALTEKLLHQRIELAGRGRDDYGRLLGRPMLAGADVGAWMVAQGHAWSYRWRSSEGPYAAEEAAARRTHRGLFADPQAIEPRTFRHDHGPCDAPPARHDKAPP